MDSPAHVSSVSLSSRSVRNRLTAVVVGLVALATGTWLSCAPGTVDCTKVNCSDLAGGEGGGGGGGGGAGGTSASISADTEVANCSKFSTLGAADAFFGERCGVATACHATGAPWSDFKAANVFMRMLDAKPKVDCTSSKMLDKANWMKSLILAKTSQATPACPSGDSPGTQMPPAEKDQAIQDKVPALTADEKTCVEEFVKAATGN